MSQVIPIVILAGGQGRRIGGDKAARRLAGKTLLHHVAVRAAFYSSIVAISAGKTTHLPRGGDTIIRDDGDIEGPVAGLKAALKFATEAGAEYVLIVPCDTPFLPDDLLQRLHKVIGDHRAAIAQCAGQLHSACSLWRVDAADLLPEYLAKGRRSLIGFAEMATYVSVDWPGSSADAFFNINTADDLARAEQLYSPP